MRNSISTAVADRIVDYIRQNNLPAGYPLAAGELADIFGLARAPVETALRSLGQEKILSGSSFRGFFVATPPDTGAPSNTNRGPAEDSLYLQIAEDRLSRKIPDRISESQLMRRYGVGRKTIQELLHQICQEGWIEPCPGHGWRFQDTLSSARGYEEAYRFRGILESQALLLPGFAVDKAQLQEARHQQEELLAGDMFSLPRARLFKINSEFHELLVSWSNNKYFLDTLTQINRLRRLIEYGVSLDRSRLAWQCKEHLAILAMLESGDAAGAALFLKSHIDRSWMVKERGVAYLASHLPAR